MGLFNLGINNENILTYLKRQKSPAEALLSIVMGNSGVSLYMYLHIYSVLPPLPNNYSMHSCVVTGDK